MKRYLRLAAAVVAFWVFDALIHALLLSDGTVPNQILRPPLHETYSRSVVIIASLSALLLYKAKTARETELLRERDLVHSAELAYRTVFNQLGEGLAVREIICDGHGNPVDYRFLDVNPAFEEITGLTKQQVIGKTGKSLFPRLSEDLIEEFGRVALSGQAARFEAYIVDLDKHFAYTVFSPGKYQFATLMIDVSERKRTEAVLRRTALFESSVAEVAKILVSKESGDVRDVLEVVASALNLSYCSVTKLKDERVISRVQEWTDRNSSVNNPLPCGFEISELGAWYETLKAGQCILAGNLSEDMRLPPVFSEMGIGALALVPIMLQDRLVGLLVCGDRQVRLWSATEVGLLVTISEIMATYHRRLQAERRMEYLTYHDSLTRVHNRTYFESKLLGAIRDKPVVSVIMGDLNGLKLINDSLGHAEGDRIIVTAAKALKAACREQDVVIRWGGDEFVMILPDADEREAAAVCRKILSHCRSSDNSIDVSISLGHATRTDTSVPIGDLIKKAEDLMYLHKIRNRRSSRHSLLSSLEHTLLELSQETKEHCDRIRELSVAVGRALGMSQSELDELALLASLHDVGKIGVPSHILLKPGLLTPEEWKVVKRHPEVGYRIVRTISDLLVIADGVLCHHERWDGTGYPRGLKGEEIPLMSRIIAIADAFDAMTSARHYRSPRSVAEALSELRRCSGTQFDPSLVPVFEKVIGEITNGRSEGQAAGLEAPN